MMMIMMYVYFDFVANFKPLTDDVHTRFVSLGNCLTIDSLLFLWDCGTATNDSETYASLPQWFHDVWPGSRLFCCKRSVEFAHPQFSSSCLLVSHFDLLLRPNSLIIAHRSPVHGNVSQNNYDHRECQAILLDSESSHSSYNSMILMSYDVCASFCWESVQTSPSDVKKSYKMNWFYVDEKSTS